MHVLFHFWFNIQQMLSKNLCSLPKHKSILNFVGIFLFNFLSLPLSLSLSLLLKWIFALLQIMSLWTKACAMHISYGNAFPKLNYIIKIIRLYYKRHSKFHFTSQTILFIVCACVRNNEKPSTILRKMNNMKNLIIYCEIRNIREKFPFLCAFWVIPSSQRQLLSRLLLYGLIFNFDHFPSFSYSISCLFSPTQVSHRQAMSTQVLLEMF